ncbi:DnaB-like helicase C-terminal domain-containing protein [Bacillus sp. SCS-151]|uniref:DnaB-like helicase C-terminal domain-containing protein n=1 Tax=Nanhaiella sioensis TaxID=3115293 RepID=UPI00397CC334
MKTLKDYNEKLVSNRDHIEASFIFCLWRNPELFSDFEKEVRADRDLLTDDGRFYYTLGYEMYKLGYKSFDDASIYSFIEDKDSFKKGFQLRGGYKTVEEIRSIVNEDNVEIYYDELVKYNMLLNLSDKGFNVIDELDKYRKMVSSQLYDYFEYQLDNIFLNRGSGVKVEDLDLDEDFIDSCDSGIEMGLSYANTSPIMNFHTLGLHLSNVLIFAGFSGTGKTSYCVNTYVMSILDQGEKIVIVANEMNKRAWQHIFMATILSLKLGYYGLPRKKQKMGNFSDEQQLMMKKAKEYYDTNYKGRIKFVKIFDYSIDDVKRVFRKMNKQGFKYGLYDTFKSENAASGNVTGELIEASKQLLQVAEKEEMGIIITMQLAIYMENTRYLTAATLSSAKGVKEVVSELIMTRPVWEDEFPDGKFDIKPYKFKKDSRGKYTKVKEYITMNPEKKYRIMFLDKTRNDGGEIAILYQFDGDWNKWTELGYCTPKHQR